MTGRTGAIALFESQPGTDPGLDSLPCPNPCRQVNRKPTKRFLTMFLKEKNVFYTCIYNLKNTKDEKKLIRKTYDEEMPGIKRKKKNVTIQHKKTILKPKNIYNFKTYERLQKLKGNSKSHKKSKLTVLGKTSNVVENEAIERTEAESNITWKDRAIIRLRLRTRVQRSVNNNFNVKAQGLKDPDNSVCSAVCGGSGSLELFSASLMPPVRGGECLNEFKNE